MQCCLEHQGQHYIKVFLVHCPMRWYSWDNIAKTKTLCSVVLEVPDNNAQENILVSVVLIFLRQHQNPMQCCLRGSRQHCRRKNLGHCCLDTLGTTLHWLKLYVMLSERLNTKLHRKNPVQLLSEQHLATLFIYIYIYIYILHTHISSTLIGCLCMLVSWSIDGYNTDPGGQTTYHNSHKIAFSLWQNELELWNVEFWD